MNLENFNLNSNDNKYLLIIAIFSLILVVYYILFSLKLGIFCIDIYIYLANSLAFTGVELGSEGTIYLAPVICILTAGLMKLGVGGELAICIVTGAFAIIGNIGLYILLKNRFRSFLSFTGAIIYSCLSLNILWLANGSLDIPAVAVTIWVAVFTIMAINKDSKYYPVAFALFIIGFLIRFTEGFILPILLVYFVYKTRLKFDKRTKKILIGSILGCIILIVGVIGILYIIHPRNLYFLEIINNAFHGSKGAEGDVAYTLDTWFYLKHFPEFISSGYTSFNGNIPTLMNATPLAYITLAITAIGALMSFENIKKIKIQNKKLAVATVILGVFTALTFNLIIGLVSIVLAMIVIIMAQNVLKDSDFKYLDINLLFLTWFLIYFMYFTYFNTKVDRYIITLMPAFIYFVLFAIDNIEFKLQNRINIKNIIPIILILLFVVNAFAFSFTVGEHKDFNEYKEITDILKEIDPGYIDKSIGTHIHRPMLWYLQKPNTFISAANPDQIDASNLTYYISPTTLNLTNYTLIAQKNELCIYKHI